MSDALWRQAEADLSLGLSSAPVDRLVWEHSARIAYLAAAIADIPELTDRALDRRALAAAALYHDAGWILQFRAGEAIPRDLLLRPTSEVQRELAAVWLEERLRDLLPARSLTVAADAVRYYNDRHASGIEAQVLAEAENLDEIGPQAIVLMVRRQMADGKTLADLVHNWQCQEEYHYWQARIKDGFRFESVRRLALERWQALRSFMNDLGRVVCLDDLALLGNVAGSPDRAAVEEPQIVPSLAASPLLQRAS